LDGNEWLASHSDPFNAVERAPISLSSGWTPELIYTCRWRENPCRYRELNPGHPVRRRPFYLQSYPGS